MATMRLTAKRGGTNGGVLIVNGAAVTGYEFMGEGDAVWGAFSPNFVLSTDKNGRGSATDASFDPRPLALPIHTVGTTAALMKSQASLLKAEALACARAGGELRWQSNAATVPITFKVIAGDYVNEMDSLMWEVRSRAVGLLGLSVEPAALGDLMGFRDYFLTDSSTDYTQDLGAFTIAAGALGYGSTGAKRFRHTGRGYNYDSVQVTVKITTGATVASADWAVAARCQGTVDTMLIARIQGSGTNLVSFATVKAGVIAPLATAAFTPAINTSYWLRLRLQGCCGIAEVFTSEPKPLDVAAFTTTEFSLSAADQQAFVSGPCGLRVNVVDTAERFRDFDVRPYTFRFASPDVIRLTGIPGDLPAAITTEVTVPAALATQAVFGGVYWAERQRQVNYCWNGNLEQTAAGNTPGWSSATVAGVVTAPGGATARDATAAKFGSACIAFTTTAVVNQGINFPMPRRFKKGRTYIGLGWAQSAAGVGNAVLALGQSGDIATSTAQALSAAWKLHSCAWTPTADRDVAYLSPQHAPATAETQRFDGGGVFEATPLVLNGAIASTGATSCVAQAVAPEGNPPVPFVSIIDAGTSSQELVRVTAIAADGVTRTIDRGWDGSTAATHLTAATMHDLPGYWFDANSDGVHGSMLDVVGIANPYSFTATDTVLSADATQRSGFKVVSTTAITSHVASVLVDPYTLVPPDFSGDEVLVEVWIRFATDANPPTPRFTAYSRGEEGATAPVRYGLENGSAGLAIISPSAGLRRFARIDIVPIRFSDAGQRRRVQIGVQYDIASAGTAVSYDYLVLVPVGQRASTPTGRLADANYPNFTPTVSAQQTRRIMSDLSSEAGLARETMTPGNLNPNGGLLPSPVYFGAPNSDALVKLSNLVPNGGVAADAAEILSIASDATLSVSFNVQPRFTTIR